MNTITPASPGILHDALAQYPLVEALRRRRSRRFAAGMRMPAGPLAYRSELPRSPLTEAEEAALAFAACGITGYALADLCYAPGQGGNIMAGLVARTIASGDGIQTVSLVVNNDEGVWLLRRPRDFQAVEIAELIELGKAGAFTEIYRRSRVKISDQRAAPPLTPIFNLNCNQWSSNAPGTTVFLPVCDLTWIYINGLLDIFNETTGAFILDERARFRPAGLRKFARSRGGHLEDDPRAGRVATIRQVECMVTEFVTIEQGMLLQNLALMSQALGLGGFPHFAAHEFGWFQALGFRMGQMPASRYLGADWLVSMFMRLAGKDPSIPYPLGLEVDGRPVLQAFCPPWVPSMRHAVRAVVDLKCGPRGVLRQPETGTAWRDTQAVLRGIPRVSEAAIEATIAYCDYVWERYGRFPAHPAPWRTVLAFQAHHPDPAFYEKFYGAGVNSGRSASEAVQG